MSEPGAAMTFLNAVPGAAGYPAQHVGGARGVLANELLLESPGGFDGDHVGGFMSGE